METQSDLGTRPPQAALRVTEAAAFLGVSVGHLNNERTKGTGPRFVKIGSRVTYRIQDLEAYQEAHLQRSTSDAA